VDIYEAVANQKRGKMVEMNFQVLRDTVAKSGMKTNDARNVTMTHLL